MLKPHPKALYDYAAEIQQLAKDLTEENLKKVFTFTDEMQNVIHCDFNQRFYLPPLEVSSEDFLADSQKWVKVAEKRMVRVSRESGLVLSFGGLTWLGDTTGWCPVCDGVLTLK